ncbi:MAG: CBS domain-containing protein [Desulfobacterales bacterium]|nr:CBS domain-containing protein [Desulfobacterales bacterium]
MKIKMLMIQNPITVTKHTSITDAIELMKTNSIRHLPVVSERNELSGFLTLADLKRALIPSMVSDLTLADIMIQNPIKLSPDDDIEFAAQLIYKNKISGMPVVEAKKLVGIITETDILRTFIDMMGILTASSRIDVEIKADPKQFKNALQIINDYGGDIINVAMTAQKIGTRTYYFRLMSCKTDNICKALEDNGFKVLEATD